jgi:hypothetical protein
VKKVLPNYIIEISKLLPKDIKKKFIHNSETLRWGHGEPSYDTSVDTNMLYHCFYWDESPEGYHYWKQVHHDYVKEFWDAEDNKYHGWKNIPKGIEIFD